MDNPYTIVLTGASTGVGARAAERLGEAGHTIYAWARNIEALHQVACPRFVRVASNPPCGMRRRTPTPGICPKS